MKLHKDEIKRYLGDEASNYGLMFDDPETGLTYSIKWDLPALVKTVVTTDDFFNNQRSENGPVGRR
jgi:hypothetical protein